MSHQRAAMEINQFFVTYRMEKWYVDNGTNCYGPYLSQRDATADAIEAAEQTSSYKKPALVLLKVPGSNATVVWDSRKVLRDAKKAELLASTDNKKPDR